MLSRFFCNSSAREIIRAHLDKLGPSGLTYAYAIVNKRAPENVIIFSNKPEWFDFYTEQNYQLTDPVALRAMNEIGDFSWTKDATEVTATSLQRVFDAAGKENIEVGHTFILHDPKDNVATLSLMTGSDSYGTLLSYIHEQSYSLQQLLVTTHQKALSLYDTCYKKGQFHGIALTTGESEILNLISTGKTYHETAALLGMSVGNVKYHIRKILKKLGARNALQAVGLAGELGLLKTK
jgi:LuxR family quorum-sensing system transcriptional regulator ExpR